MQLGFRAFERVDRVAPLERQQLRHERLGKRMRRHQ